MGTIQIIDSGYLTTNVGDDSPETKATQVNSGSAITLNTANMVMASATNIDDSPIAGFATTGGVQSTINKSSITNRKWTITGSVDGKVSGDLDTLALIEQLRRTIGIKVIYYSDSSDNWNDLIEAFGATDTAHNGSGKLLATGIKHLHVDVIGVRIRRTAPSGLIPYTIDMLETA